MAERNRFVTLDALRGIAAIGVMLYHSMPDSPLVIPGGYLAVDLFFVLSGFVIALTYEDKLRDGMTPREFLALRAIRLWPMLLVGAGLGIALYGGHAGMLFSVAEPALRHAVSQQSPAVVADARNRRLPRLRDIRLAPADPRPRPSRSGQRSRAHGLRLRRQRTAA